MKKLMAVLTIVALLGMVGCGANSFLCKNKDTILQGLQFIINQSDAVIASIRAQYPNMVPPFVQDILDKAQQAHDTAAAAMSKACPVVVDLTNAQMPMTQAMQKMQMSGMKVGK